MRPELDACGIGFVADAHGRASRAIVEAALHGLACVRHRGAVAADAKTADGSGVLLPIPPAIFGEDNGVAMLFVRGDDPREAVEAAAAEERLRVVEWREPPTHDRELGEQALASRPRIVQMVFNAERADERAAFRPRRGNGTPTEARVVADGGRRAHQSSSRQAGD